MARDDDFFGKVGSIFKGGGGSSRTGGDSESFEDFAARYGQTQQDGQRAGTFRYGQTPEEMPRLPRRLATYPHGYSYSQGKYPGGVPRYFDGDEALPARIAPHNIAAIQRALVTAGLLDSPRWGVWDPSSQEAYQTVLSEANRAGVDVQTLLTRYEEAAQIGTQEQAVFTPPEALPLKLPSDEDLRHVTRGVVIEKLGVGWDADDINAFVGTYKAMAQRRAQQAYEAEVGRQRQAFDAGQPVSNVAVELDIPTVEAYADEELRRRDPGGYQATQVAEDYMPAFFEALGGFT